MDGKIKIFQLKNIVTPKFLMNPIELKDYIDFEAKRIYFITDIVSATGSHCHKIEKEFFVMVQGSATAVIDKGEGLEEIKMQAPGSAIFIDSGVWHGFKDFSIDAILLAISSTNYNPDRKDYVEDYEEFKKIFCGR